MILAVGSINVDYIIHSKRMPYDGETMYGKQVTIMAGGKASNQIAAASRLGAHGVLLSKYGGMDGYLEKVFNDLKWANVDTQYVEAAEGEYCGSGYIMVNETGDNRIIIIEGANGQVTPQYVEKNLPLLQKATLCMAEFMIPMNTCEYLAAQAKKYDIPIIVNPSPTRPMPDEMYKGIYLLIPNEHEAEELTGIQVETERDALECSHLFHQKGVKNVIITLGKRGAFVSDGSCSEMVPAYPVTPLDTSGAGDSFNGGVAYALSKGKTIFEAARFGNAVASQSIQRTGTMQSMPSLAEVEAIYKL